MTTPDQVRYARRFTATIPNRPDLHGIEFPSGRIIADHPTGLTAYLTIQAITDEHEDAVIHWVNEEQP